MNKLTVQEVEPKIPVDIRKAIADDPKASALWKTLTPIARRDFIFWIESAKQEETRKRRIESLGSRLASGKRRPCCFAVVPMNFYKALSGTPKAKVTWKELTPTEKRDFVGWIEEAKDADARKARAEKACLLLASGKKRFR
jgi:uncharacterized protein YdeI (YjbR/CyaY-like superfamily)